LRDEYLIVLIVIGMIIFGQYLKRQIKSDVKDNNIKLLNKEIKEKESLITQNLHNNKEENELIKDRISKDKIKSNKKKQIVDESEKVKDKAETIVNNETMMQMFEWYSPNDGTMYEKIRESIKDLNEKGITAIWMPPASKAAEGINDVGYGSYDLYDLGEFNQKGTIRTKYGTKEQYLKVISEAHKYNIKVYADIVFNHKAGADESEIVQAIQVEDNNRNMIIGKSKEIESHTVFNFSGRSNKYSEYKWTAKDFTGVDFDNLTKKNGIYRFLDKEWAKDVDPENGNYDYLMFADIDINSKEVQDELIKWGKWFIDETHIDGFRLDAVKHIQFDFFNTWLSKMREYTNKDMFAVGEYWSYDVERLKYYMEKSGQCMNLFDVPLHFAFYEASRSFGHFDMRKLIEISYLKADPNKTCTFVDNHDTQIGQSLQSWIEPWFKPIAYTFILTRKEGYPCVFYGDYYGIKHNNYAGIQKELDAILMVRKNYAYGIQHDYIDDANIIGWTREGDCTHKNSGLAAIITDECGGQKEMYVGIKHAGEIFVDATNNLKDEVTIDNNGNGIFKVKDGGYSIWIKK